MRQQVRAMSSDDSNIAGGPPAAEPGLPKSDQAAMSTVAGAGYTLVSLWLTMLASFVEGFDVYLASRAMTAADYRQGKRSIAPEQQRHTTWREPRA